MGIILVAILAFLVITKIENFFTKGYIKVLCTQKMSEDEQFELTFLEFGKKRLKNIKQREEGYIYIPYKKNSLFCGRKIVMKTSVLDGTTTYDHNGYENLTQEEMRMAFLNVVMSPIK